MEESSQNPKMQNKALEKAHIEAMEKITEVVLPEGAAIFQVLVTPTADGKSHYFGARIEGKRENIRQGFLNAFNSQKGLASAAKEAVDAAKSEASLEALQRLMRIFNN